MPAPLFANFLPRRPPGPSPTFPGDVEGVSPPLPFERARGQRQP